MLLWEPFQTVAEKKAKEEQQKINASKQAAAARIGPEFQMVNTELEQEFCMFNPEFYHRMYPSLLPSKPVVNAPMKYTDSEINTLRSHYVITGVEEGRSPCGSMMPHCTFQPTEYMDRYPDIKDMIKQGQSKDAIDHFRKFGIHESRPLCFQDAKKMDRMVWGCDTGDKEVTLSCPKGSFISRGVMEYGRWNNSICPSVDDKGKVTKFGGILSTTPYVRRTYPLPPRCMQSNSCTLSKDLSADTGIDPVPNTYKHYQIRYRCD
jgi:hypothetical protein